MGATGEHPPRGAPAKAGHRLDRAPRRRAAAAGPSDRVAENAAIDTDVGAFKIRLAASHDARRDASYLVQRRYAQQGYQTSAVASDAQRLDLRRVRRRPPCRDGQPASRLASPGLAADELYRLELDAHPARRAPGLRVHAARGGHDATVAARARGPVPYGVSVRATGSQLRFRRDRGQSPARRLLPAIARIRGDRRRAPQSARRRAGGADGNLVRGASPSICSGTRPRRGAPEGEKPVRVRILARRRGRSARAGCARSMRASRPGGRTRLMPVARRAPRCKD